MSSLRINPCGSGIGADEAWATVLAPWLTAKYLPSITGATRKEIKEQKKLVAEQRKLVATAGAEAQAEHERQLEWRRLRGLITSQITANTSAIRLTAGMFNRDYEKLYVLAESRGVPTDEITPLKDTVIQVMAQLPNVDVSSSDLDLLEQHKSDTDTWRWVTDEAYKRLMAFGRKMRVQVDEAQARADQIAHQAVVQDIKAREDAINRERRAAIEAIKEKEKLYKRLIELRNLVAEEQARLDKDLELLAAGERELRANAAVRAGIAAGKVPPGAVA